MKKIENNAIITEEEFIAISGGKYEPAMLKKVYAVLAELCREGKMTAAILQSYARFKWCLNSPEAIIAYENFMTDEWIVNRCDLKICENEAIIRINREFGFEASKIKIIGTPYYDSTDFQFIRFDVCGYSWLWADEGIYNVYSD